MDERRCLEDALGLLLRLRLRLLLRLLWRRLEEERCRLEPPPEEEDDDDVRLAFGLRLRLIPDEKTIGATMWC